MFKRTKEWNFDPKAPVLTDAKTVTPSGKVLKYPVGLRSGSLEIVAYKKELGGTYRPFVRCDCGWEGMFTQANFDQSRRCIDCSYAIRLMYTDIIPDRNTRDRLLSRLASMRQRCHNPKSKSYENYGGRGIRVCQAWIDDRGEFLRHARTLDGWDVVGLEIDRIDVNGNYEPGNIRFVCRAENACNRRKVSDLERRISELLVENKRLTQKLEALECSM